MKKLILFVCLFAAIAVQAQKERVEAYISNYKELAMQEMIRTGVPASITLAQGILESQWGESELVKSSNNHFGIKCKTEWTGPKVYHDDDEKGECFRVYSTAEDSYKDHSDFLKTRPNYAFLFKLDPTDFEGWAKGLKKAGYATSPVYPQKLLKVINDYNLQQYSLTALARINHPAPASDMPGTNSAATTTTVTAAVMKEDTGIQTTKPLQEQVVVKQSTGAATADSAPVNSQTAVKAKKTTSYPSGIFTINHTKVIYAAEGTSFLSLANQYDIPLSKLIEFNDLAEMDVLDMDRLIFIEKKQKKGASDFHMVAAGETLHDICQSEGVRLENLLEYNHLSKTSRPAVSDRIFLKTVPVPATTAVAKSLKK